MGAVGAFGTGQVTARGPGGGGPPGQSCECPSEEVFLAKYDFACIETECVEEDPDTGECLEEECVDWGFVLAEGEDLVDITYDAEDPDYNKDGETAEPNFIELDAPDHVITHICAYGGRDTSEAEEPDGLTEFASDLTNPGGQEAAISNITFCGEETEVFPECPMYGTSREDPTGIFAIFADPDTGEIEEIEIGEIPDKSANSNYPNGVAFDPEDEVWYFAEDTGELMTMNEDGDLDTIKEYGVVHPAGDAIAGAAFYEGKYYFIPNNTNALRAVDVRSDSNYGTSEDPEGDFGDEEVTELDWSGFNLGDLEFDRDADVLYVSTANTNESGANFFKVDMDDFSQEEFVNEDDGDRSEVAISAQIAFDDDNNLWAHNAANGDWQIVDLVDEPGHLGDVVETTREYTDLAQCGFTEHLDL